MRNNADPEDVAFTTLLEVDLETNLAIAKLGDAREKIEAIVRKRYEELSLGEGKHVVTLGFGQTNGYGRQRISLDVSAGDNTVPLRLPGEHRPPTIEFITSVLVQGPVQNVMVGISAEAGTKETITVVAGDFPLAAVDKAKFYGEANDVLPASKPGDKVEVVGSTVARLVLATSATVPIKEPRALQHGWEVAPSGVYFRTYSNISSPKDAKKKVDSAHQEIADGCYKDFGAILTAISRAGLDDLDFELRGVVEEGDEGEFLVWKDNKNRVAAVCIKGRGYIFTAAMKRVILGEDKDKVYG